MSDLKTKRNKGSVTTFLDSVKNKKRRDDSYVVLDIMKEITGSEPEMWGTSIIGFGTYHYKYKSGREGDWFLCGFSPRVQSLTLYIMTGFSKYEEILRQIGKYKTGKACFYINKIEDINLDVLKELIRESVDFLKTKNQN
ncbi:DUF1801 domain-containing protein [Bacteroidota bacterium]